MKDAEISAEFPFESKYLEVKGSRMHYVEDGEGDPILFLHGQPMWSYLWRNVIPHVSNQGRCIAPDLIGMGKSDKPDIDYTFDDQYAYLEEFIERMELKNITLVIHDWGSGLGLHYANMHSDNVKAIAFMDAMVRTVNWEDMPLGYAPMFKMIRAPFIGWLMLSVGNMFLKKVMPDLIVRKLTREETNRYMEPYPTIASRKAIRMWPKELPISGKPEGVYKKQIAWIKNLSESQIPKLCLYMHPGGIILEKDLDYVRNSFPNIKMVDVGEGKHFIQEDNPHGVGNAISQWYREIK